MYATLSDLVARYGEGEVARLSAAPDALDGGPDQARVDLALADATALIESYIRRRFVTPLAPVPPEIAACCCAIVRYQLAQGEGRQPTETMRADYADRLKWLALLAAGNASLPGAATIAADSSFARMQDRPALYQPPRAGGLY
jgi:phage gp36-like protein